MKARCERQRTEALEKYRNQAISRGWQLLDTAYIDQNTRLSFICGKGHSFVGLPRYFMEKGCTICARGPSIVAEEKMYAKVAEHGGKIVEGSYVNSGSLLTFECKEGHLFRTTSRIVINGSWCKACADRCPKQAAERYMARLLEMKAKAADLYAKSADKVRVICEQDHLFETTPSRIKEGYWCPKCAERCPEQAAELYYAVVKEREGTPLEAYVNTEVKLKIRCKNLHTFSARPDTIKGGSWCPECNESKGERAVEAALQKLGLTYRKQEPYLPNTRMHYDFFITYQGKAVYLEFDGKFHFEEGCYRSKETLAQAQHRDREKTTWVLDAGHRMIRIEHKTFRSTPDLSGVLTELLERKERLVLSRPEMYSWLTDGLTRASTPGSRFRLPWNSS